MKLSWVSLITLCGIGTFLFSQENTDRKLTARELFYASDSPAPTPHKTAKSAAKPKPVPSNPPSAQPPTKTQSTTTPVIAVAYRPQGPYPALGLRYTLLKRTGDGLIETATDAVFHAGDRIRLAVETNDDGYLYVVNRGSSGTWKVLFPSAEIKDGDNHIQRRARFEIPSGYAFVFDEQPGAEKLFIVLSRQPEPDLESLIYSLGQKSATPAEPQKPKMLLASAAFNDDVIGKLRNAYARDLIVEKVDDDEPGPKKEKAVYAVNPSGSADSRVVADVTLRHEK